MRAPNGPAAPDKRADPIIVHPDVRRMLLTMKAFTEGGRALAYFTAMQLDGLHNADDAARERASAMLDFLIPITKGFLTESGFESTYWGIQVFGGHGYIRETGIEQTMRDCRIASIYEGTNAIQGNDLLRRKVLGSKGELLELFLGEVDALLDASKSDAAMAPFAQALSKAADDWKQLTGEIAERAANDKNEIGAAAFDYLMYSGYVVVGYFWARMAKVAAEKLAAGASGDEARFYRAKQQTARFYFERILPRAWGLAQSIRAGADSLMDIPEDAFIF
jgi:hypothetical protein